MSISLIFNFPLLRVSVLVLLFEVFFLASFSVCFLTLLFSCPLPFADFVGFSFIRTSVFLPIFKLSSLLDLFQI